MLKSWIFEKSNILILTIKFLFLIKKLPYKGLERSITHIGAKKRYYLIFLIIFDIPNESMSF